MTDEEIREFAREVVEDHATDIEFMSVWELYDAWHAEEISKEDAIRVHDLATKARVTVWLPGDPE
jgi:hypothetical protein